MKIQRLHPSSIPHNMKSINVDSIGQKIMGKKTSLFAFEIRDLSFEAAHILKQESLSVGGDCATPRDSIRHKGENIAILFGTKSQLEKMLPKLAIQPFGLKELKKQLETHLKTTFHKPSIMAIVNITPDSFYADSRHDTKSAIDRIHQLLQKEVDIVDIGAASSRPGSELICPDDEISRLKDIAKHIYKHNLYEKALFSIDTYNPQTADYALSSGFHIVNDVSGFSAKDMPKVCAKHKAKAILMHTKGTPKSMQNLTHTYTHLFCDIDDFFAQKIELLKKEGIEDVILDIGFGFAKDNTQNISLIKHLSHFEHFGLPLLVGASRKNTIGEITHRQTQDRLYGTLALHLYALQNGANILRVHDEDAHIDMLRVYKAMQ